MTTLQVDVVSAEASLFSGEAKFVALPGVSGELGIYPRHTPLITRIRPGSVRIEQTDGEHAYIFVAGGILEVQPDGVTVLADTAIRGEDLDEEKAQAAKVSAEAALSQASTDQALAEAQAELGGARAQLALLRHLQSKK